MGLAGVLSSLAASGQPGAGTEPMIRPDAIVAVSDHAYVIPDDNVALVPNVGIVVGERATLVIDTGLGERNGEIVHAAARELSKHDKFFVTATHYHPEHDLGATAFPPSAAVVRSVDQQAEIDEFGLSLAERFATFAPIVAELLDGARFRPVDVLFDDTLTLDLGGVRVKIMAFGPTHTRGDMAFFVEGEGVLFAGDLVMPTFLAVNRDYSSVDAWLDSLAELAALKPRIVVPAHGRNVDASMIATQQRYLSRVRTRARELRAGGRSADEAAETLAGELAAEFSMLERTGAPPALGRIGSAVRAVYREAP
jgi:glyoxylase-like metal-dependent hydrolase (beta-lactamase superfamily II)